MYDVRTFLNKSLYKLLCVHVLTTMHAHILRFNDAQFQLQNKQKKKVKGEIHHLDF